MLQECVVGLVDDVPVERPDVDLCRADRVMPQGLADDGHAHSILTCHRGPAVTAHIGREFQSTKHGAQFAERLVIQVDSTLVLVVHLPLVMLFRENGKQIGRVSRIAADDVTHLGLDMHLDALSCFTSDIGDDITLDIGLFEECHIDKGESS